jgi:ATPase subunit of ABC transporter with duplicated ATPase domains
VHARSVSLTFGRETILHEADLSIGAGRRIGLVGPNGVGKSTLLRVLAGELAPESGTVDITPRDAVIGYLPQEPHRRAGETVTELLMRRTGVSAAQRALDDSTTALARGEADADEHYAHALERWLTLGAADFDARLRLVADDIGLPESLLDAPMTTLSGGEAARAGLAALLLSKFDVVLLDEPTNDLDVAGLERLEEWVTSVAVPLVVVSHDREFLRRTVTHVAELDEFSHRLEVYAGGWDTYLEERAVAARHARERYEEYADKRAVLNARAQREREWASQGLSKAKKKRDDNDKFIKAFKIDQTEQLAARAARTERALERLEEVEEPREAWRLQLVFGQAPRPGAVVARLNRAVVRRGSFTLGPVDLTIGHGERVAVRGRNGSGKTTLIDTIVGRRRPDEGEARLGPSVVVGELEQARSRFAADAALLDGFVAASGLTNVDARTLLAKFGLGAGDVHRIATELSPGERTRAVLALLMARGTNLLVLDEPTNHLDLAAIEQLEVALDAFAGTVLLVTHDRALLERVRLDRVIDLAAGAVVGDTAV